MAATEEKLIRVQFTEQLVGCFSGVVPPKGIKPGGEFDICEVPNGVEITRRSKRDMLTEEVVFCPYGGNFRLVKTRPRTDAAGVAAREKEQERLEALTTARQQLEEQEAAARAAAAAVAEKQKTAATESSPQRGTDDGQTGVEPAGRRARSTGRAAGGNE